MPFFSGGPFENVAEKCFNDYYHGTSDCGKTYRNVDSGFFISGDSFENVAGNRFNGYYHNTSNCRKICGGVVDSGTNNHMQSPPQRHGQMEDYPQRPSGTPRIRPDPSMGYDDYDDYNDYDDDDDDDDHSNGYKDSHRPLPTQKTNGRDYRNPRPAPPQQQRSDIYAAQERAPKQQARGLRDLREPQSRTQAPQVRRSDYGEDDGERGYPPRGQRPDYDADDWDVRQCQPPRHAPPSHIPKDGSDYGLEEDHPYQSRRAPQSSRRKLDHVSDHDSEGRYISQHSPRTQFWF
ncbi:hypothetical protein Moror_5580 [Moniliophthora roreri MCA 2997]|uniref:Uncharacterized protein n=2 Tax=Moniliophthora roreri TaxID=221103 RepID=V2WMU7_MONRO|nr:hypothetical protein Moror_5580 [Moniliophthora roreri MCA 2997]